MDKGREIAERIKENIKRVIVGKDETISLLITALISNEFNNVKHDNNTNIIIDINFVDLIILSLLSYLFEIKNEFELKNGI